ncbi:MAG: hypothetical protein ACI8R4_000058 [Paracoccaceae bacterium]|jgi:hypothetical protein
MKFIRDIISEKANLAGRTGHTGRTGRETPERDMALESFRDQGVPMDQTDDFAADLADADVDLVHKVASGGQSLSGALGYAFAAEAPEKFEALYKDVALDPPEMDYGDPVGDDGDHDGLTDTALLEPLDDGNTEDASELFGDLWPETKMDTPETDAGPVADEPPLNAEIDMDALRSIQDIATPAIPPLSMPEMSETPEMPEMAAAPVSPPARPATRAVLSDGAPERPAPAAPAAPAEDLSAFQRMVRREKQTSPDVPARQVQPASDMRDETSNIMPAEISAAPAVEMPKTIKVPAPASGRAGRHAGRVKTRLLGFNTAQDSALDPFDNRPSPEPAAASIYPVGWMVVIDGPGRGNAFTLFDGVSQIGRGEGQAIQLDFGDNSISRSNHAAIAYDGEQQSFFVGHGGKANLVRLNGNPVLSTEQLANGAEIRIGETTLRFVALCGNEFDWGVCQDDDVENAQFG